MHSVWWSTRRHRCTTWCTLKIICWFICDSCPENTCYACVPPFTTQYTPENFLKRASLQTSSLVFPSSCRQSSWCLFMVVSLMDRMHTQALKMTFMNQAGNRTRVCLITAVTRHSTTPCSVGVTFFPKFIKNFRCFWPGVCVKGGGGGGAQIFSLHTCFRQT